jgi:hypothetical protein
MIVGKVEKSYDEQIKEKGRASLTMAWTYIIDGVFTKKPTGEIGNYRVDSNTNQILVNIDGRVVIYEIKDLLLDAIHELEKKDGIVNE